MKIQNIPILTELALMEFLSEYTKIIWVEVTQIGVTYDIDFRNIWAPGEKYSRLKMITDICRIHSSLLCTCIIRNRSVQKGLWNSLSCQSYCQRGKCVHLAQHWSYSTCTQQWVIAIAVYCLMFQEVNDYYDYFQIFYTYLTNLIFWSP